MVRQILLSSRRPVWAVGVALAVSIMTAAQLPTDDARWRPELPLGLDLYMPVPESNPLTAEKVALGRRLFFDPLLSRDQKHSCASCHDPQKAFTDGRAVAVGVFGREGSRNTPTLINRAYGMAFFWDGRSPSLEEQVLKPIQDSKEMNMSIDEVVARLKTSQGYEQGFHSAFRRDINGEDVARALASYVRSILSGDSPFDRYLSGDMEALSGQQREGLHLFRTKANCAACHLGPNFSDEAFHNTGIAWRDGAWRDPGRFPVTAKERDRGAFKTPTLREIARTAPYMHDGSLATLEDIVDFYSEGGRQNPFLDPEIRPLHLTPEEKRALAAFLRSLSGQLREGLR